ncbi:MAG: hypothetical protein AAFY49_04090 [Pseudomonadota bacterium]
MGWVGLLVALAAGPVRADGQWYAAGLVGSLTEGSWHEALIPRDVQFAGSSMIGAAIGVERPLGNSRWRIGVEAQVVAHAGAQDHFELSVPITLRYTPRRLGPVESLAAGLGLSYATEIPQVEIDRNGASQRLFVHWLAEVEFALPRDDLTTFVRLHHRSDGYGLFEVDAGSTGYVLGLRKRF